MLSSFKFFSVVALSLFFDSLFTCAWPHFVIHWHLVSGAVNMRLISEEFHCLARIELKR